VQVANSGGMCDWCAKSRFTPPVSPHQLLGRADRSRTLTELPWWLRTVAINILLRLKLVPLARLLGTQGTAGPH
jgi:hypothetical protein